MTEAMVEDYQSPATQQFVDKAVLQYNNNNNNNESPSQEELQLLAKLDEANKAIETDAKSLNSLSGASGHSRRSSDTSQISVTSGASSGHDRTDDPEEDTWGTWGRVVNEWEAYQRRKAQYVKELVRKGVPHHFRGIVWQLLCSAHNSPDKQKYADYIKATSACEKSIRRDIARTYPEHDFFKEKDGTGQESLFNVMKAYSVHDREVGYCQGSAFIVGLLLMQMPEEEAFAVVVKLMQEYRMREMFKPSMAELGLCMFQLESLVQELLPELHVHFQSQSFHTSMYASSWFLTLFTTALPLPLACRVLDCFLCDGVEVIFRVAVAILSIGKEDILSLDMEGMLKYFQKDMPTRFEADPDGHFNLAYGIKYSSKKMKKLEKEYTAKRTKEQEDLVELRRLRTENRLLRQQIDYLEQESASLADRLIQGQVCRAEEAELSFAIKRELAGIRQHDSETTRQLSEAKDRIRKLSEQLSEGNSWQDSSLNELQVKMGQQEELVRCLQAELVTARLEQAEREAASRDLRARIQELEEEVRTLREKTPDDSVAHLQEELIATRLREAESNLALKELRQKVTDLRAEWQRHLEERADSPDKCKSSESTPSKKLLFWDNNRGEVTRLEEELMTTKLRETETVAELRELRHRVMELEAQVQVSGNQMKRQDDEKMRLEGMLEKAERDKKGLKQSLKDSERKYADLESRMKEELMMARIRDAENSQSVAELAQKISSLEMKNEEMVAEGELSCVGENDQVKELQDKVAELKAEILRLEHVNKSLNRRVSLHNILSPRTSLGTDEDEITEELHLKLDADRPVTPIFNGSV